MRDRTCYIHCIQVAQKKQKADLVLKNAMYLNVFTNTFMTADIAIADGYFAGIGEYAGFLEIDMSDKTIVPGLIDGHMHLESSIVTPAQYAKAVIPHGTTSIVADPHEIANVLGKSGIDYILDSTEKLPLDVYIMVPSCVPSTPFDETGSIISPELTEMYMQYPRVLGLAEMMNYPGVLSCDSGTIEKLPLAVVSGKIVDGHGPGLTGAALQGYIAAGIRSDHECTTAEEAIEKLQNGQWIMIREGTAGRNLEKLRSLLVTPYCERCLFVTDDKHPGELAEEGHIDHIIRKAIAGGADPVICYKVASWNAANYFHLQEKGAIAPGYMADFVVLDDVRTVSIHAVYKNGVQMSRNNLLLKEQATLLAKINQTVQKKYTDMVGHSVKTGGVTIEQLQMYSKKKIIGLVPGEILTTDEGEADCIDISRDILKLCVVERHHALRHTGVAFVKGYGLTKGAVATSISHDAHNLIIVGTNDTDILYAIQRIEDMQGGMTVVCDGKVLAELALPIAGLMCDLPVEEAQKKMDEVKAAAYELGASRTIDPLMTLSFVSLAVIPKLRLTTKGVVDVEKFELVE